MYTLSTMASDLACSTVYLNGLRERFELPKMSGAGYSRPYFLFLRNIVYLRTLEVSEKTIIQLWTLEKKLLYLLNIDPGNSSTWFLDQCGKRKFPRRRLLLSNVDTGTDLFGRSLQPRLPLAGKAEELFAGHEMGEDLFRVLTDYLQLYESMRKQAERHIPIVRAAAHWANRLPQRTVASPPKK